MNKNLLQETQYGLLSKIKKWLFKFLNKQQKFGNKEQNVLRMIEDEIGTNKFIESIKVETKDKILMLQKQVKLKQMEISDLTDEELEEMIKLYEEQIEQKKNKLKQYRKRIL